MQTEVKLGDVISVKKEDVLREACLVKQNLAMAFCW